VRWSRAQWALIGAASLATAFLTAGSEFGHRIDHAARDVGVRFLLHEVASDIVIIGIDAKSLAELDEWPWPRRYHAGLINTLASAAPRRVFLDIDFSSHSNPEDDERLRDALAAWPAEDPILPAFRQRQSSSSEHTVYTEPIAMLRPHVGVASVNLLPDVDGLVRRVDGGTSAHRHAGPVADVLLDSMPSPALREIWIDYSIDPTSFLYLSYSDVLAHRVPAEYYADKTVLVGATAIELGDMLPVPIHRSLPGVVVQALALESVRNGNHREPAAGLYWTALALLTLLCSYGLSRLTWQQNIGLVAISVTAAAASSLAAYAVLGLIVDFVAFAVALTTAYLLSTIRSLKMETLRAIAYAIGFRRHDALLKSIVLSSTDCILCIDSAGIVKTANPAASELFGRAAQSLTGHHIGPHLPMLDAAAADTAALGLEALANDVFESIGRTANGDDFPVELSVSRVRLQDQHLYTIIVRDISERKAQQRQLQFQATHDPLTSLPNRAALAAHLDARLARLGPNEQLALLMIDLNRFKEVNDTLGHNIGDYVLHEVAVRMARIASAYGFIARIGGDEFALVTDRLSDAGRIAEVSRRLVECLKQPVETCGIAIDVGLSIGIATSSRDTTNAETLFKQADVAMYSAKRNHSGFEYYNRACDKNSVRRLQIATRLRRAIEDGRLELHYQPQVDLNTGCITSVEALLRWNDEELGQVSPGEFIALAELTDLIRPLTDWTLTRAFSQAVRWRDAGLTLRVAVNVSARALQDSNFPDRLRALLLSNRLSPSQVELEITESAMMIDPKRALQIIGAINELGVLIAIDDYGTGYSSLAYLRDLPVHALKLDKSFVMNMQSSEDDRIIVESTARMAHALRVQAVAEGVESRADEELLRGFGYDLGQGYLYSPALAPEKLARWVREFYDAPRRSERPRLIAN
jgi:diguanylate cyclase (GGDEF)-like protein/PAS domain S-box-containing protein